jgi:hypothetical protein
MWLVCMCLPFALLLSQKKPGNNANEIAVRGLVSMDKSKYRKKKKKPMKLNAEFIEAFCCYRLHTIFYPTHFSQC